MPSDLHPEGLFAAEVETCYACRSQVSGLPQIYVKFKTEHGYLADYMSLSDAATKFTAKKLANMNYLGGKLSEIGKSINLCGTPCQIRVVHNIYKNEPEARVKWVFPSDYDPQIVEGEEIDAISHKVNAMIKENLRPGRTGKNKPATGNGRVVPYRPPAPAASADDGPGDELIPF